MKRTLVLRTSICFILAASYSSSNGGGAPGAGGLVGWSVVSGRVLSFSSLAGITEMNDSSYARLFANSVDWVSDGAPVPEPATMMLMGIGALALALKRRRTLSRIQPAHITARLFLRDPPSGTHFALPFLARRNR